MNAQLNNMAQRRTWRRHAKPMSTAVGPQHVAPGADGNLWFTDPSRGSIGRITPSGQTTEFPARLNPGSTPNGIAPRPDGDVWFANPLADAIGRIGPGGGVGHPLACRATVTYPLPFQLTATATSAAIAIQPALPPPPPSTPVLSALNVSPERSRSEGAGSGGAVSRRPHSSRTHHACTRRAAFRTRFTLSQGATVTLTTQRASSRPDSKSPDDAERLFRFPRTPASRGICGSPAAASCGLTQRSRSIHYFGPYEAVHRHNVKTVLAAT